MKKLIICADDFGYSPGINKGIIACLKAGLVQSTAVLINQPSTDEIIPFVKNNQHYSFGIHLFTKAEKNSLPNFEQQLELYYKKIGQQPAHISLHCAQKTLAEFPADIRKEIVWNTYILAKKHQIYLRGTKSNQVLTYRASENLAETTTDFKKMLRKAKNGITEVIVHPGYAHDPSLVSYYPAPLRDNERKVLTSQETLAYTEQANLEMVSYSII